ncbi:uncharacterized protein LOC111400320 [Olea europaea var. sylvestris]|uniref:uncharacterized protein LOC111400320 n=1 Tax=Olea europaea var. sylvestris TaxID=158386 RepID=UPI000C1D48E0|nr:uncharacterized protein LOC111400320 [Olea europaea var. sylvestris]
MEIEYLGHIILKKGVAADQIKIKVMCDGPSPRNLRDLHRFLGLTEYHQRFVKGYGKLAWPLTERLRKENFYWDKVAKALLQKLKEAVVLDPVLALPDFRK